MAGAQEGNLETGQGEAGSQEVDPELSQSEAGQVVNLELSLARQNLKLLARQE